jgi:predicted dehydrogenase
MQASEDRPTVALIGLGNIGFRHLQGLTRVGCRLRMVAVDPDQAALDRASAEWASTVGTPLETISDLGALPRETRVSIIATSAAGRLDILRRILFHTAPEVVVLEKVVFQRLGDFDEAASLAAASGAKVFVNCPRRLWPLYQSLVKIAERGSDFALSFRGRSLGLACNSVHFIDALQFVSRSATPQLVSANLGEVFPSKRAGYFELFGSLSFATDRGLLHLEVLPDGPDSLEATVVMDGCSHVLSEAEGRVAASDGKVLCNVGRGPFQSELTGTLVANILDGVSPGLATLADSRAAHAALFSALELHFQRQGVDTSLGLPIT